MDSQKIFVINNSYMIGNDEKRLYITYRHHPKLIPFDKSGADANFFSFLHPEVVKILTLFDGTADIPSIIENTSEKLNISKEESEKLIFSIINNKKRIGITYKGEKYVLPPKIIVPLIENETFCIYSHEYIKCKTTDFSQARLFKFPLDITFMVNTMCFVDCIYCYADCRNRMDCIIPQNCIEKLIADCRKNGVRTFDLMGGEVFMYKNWQWLIKKMTHYGFTPYISTKIPIPLKIICEIQNLGIPILQISLDSFEPTIIEKNLNITDGINYIKKMRYTLENARNKGLKINIHSVITNYNKSITHLTKFIEELSQYSNINSLQISIVGESLYKHGFQNIKLQQKDAMKLEQFISENRTNYLININFSSNYSKSMFFDDFNVKESKFRNRGLCTGNVRQVYILPNGDVTICEELMFHPKFILGNIIQDDLQTIWKRNNLMYLEDINTYKNSICGKCMSFDTCKKGIASKGVCWKEILHAYGEDKWNYPDPKCPYAPKKMNKFYIE